MNLRGKIVLLTGARRVGRDLAQRLAERGATIALTYRTSRDVIERTVAELTQSGTSAMAIEADLAKAGAAQKAVAHVVERFGRLDVLVSMASTFRKTPFARLTPADFEEMIATNLAAPYFTAVAAGRVMLEQDAEDGIKGKIITVGDWATDRPPRDLLPYVTAKGGLTAMTLALAQELAPDVLVNLVQPATVKPPPGVTAESLAATVERTPVGRIGNPSDLNRLILYLLEGTDYATGGVYRIDGGRFLGTDG
jgi:pteridine reductase